MESHALLAPIGAPARVAPLTTRAVAVTRCLDPVTESHPALESQARRIAVAESIRFVICPLLILPANVTRSARLQQDETASPQSRALTTKERSRPARRSRPAAE